MDVVERFKVLQQSHENVRLYALVDGLQYEQYTGRRLEWMYDTNRPIFHGTQDEPLAHAGPWLIATSEANQMRQLCELEQAVPSLSWLITAIDLEGLAQVLQLKLDAQLPDGRPALLRFYDPRVLGNLCRIMTAEQLADFLSLIDEWHFIYDGRRVWIGNGVNA